jgi:uncharacterized protein (DUF433 family)
MQNLTRITRNPEVMGGKPCIRGMRVTVGTIVGLIASGHSVSNILKAYPYLEEADIYEALAYVEWRAEENTQSETATQELLAIPGLLERVKQNQTTPKTDFTNWRTVRQQFQSE